MVDVGARRSADWRVVLCAWLVTLQIADIVTTKVGHWRFYVMIVANNLYAIALTSGTAA